MEPSIPFHTLVKLIDAEVIMNEKNRTFDLPLETNTLRSKLESQKLSGERYGPNPESMCTQTMDPSLQEYISLPKTL